MTNIIDSLAAKQKTEQDTQGGGKGPSQATVLVELALNNGEVFLSQNDEPFAFVEGKTLSLRGGGGFTRWLGSRFYRAEGKAPSSQAMADALATLDAEAAQQPARTVWLRTAEQAGCFYVDIGDPDRTAVRITRDGWAIVNHPRVHFWRPPRMQALPLPQRGGSLDPLWDIVHAKTERARVLLTAWLIAALRPKGPYPILVPAGEQGSGKSTSVCVLRKLTDPNAVLLRTAPNESKDVGAMAKNAWVVAIDNMSGCPPWLSDDLARLATGAGFGGRQYYTNDGEALFTYMRPIILAGIDSITTRPDLQDRAINERLAYIPPDKRVSEKRLWRKFERMAPGMLGALLDGVAASMNEDEIELHELPRMADFAAAMVAAESATPWPAGTFMKHYDASQREAVETNVEEDMFAQAVLTHIPFKGTARDLLNDIRRSHSPSVTESKAFPNSARGVSNKIRRIAPNLRRLGHDVEFIRSHGKNLIIISEAAQGAEAGVHREAPGVHGIPAKEGGLACHDVENGHSGVLGVDDVPLPSNSFSRDSKYEKEERRGSPEKRGAVDTPYTPEPPEVTYSGDDPDDDLIPGS